MAARITQGAAENRVSKKRRDFGGPLRERTWFEDASCASDGSNPPRSGAERKLYVPVFGSKVIKKHFPLDFSKFYRLVRREKTTPIFLLNILKGIMHWGL